MTKRKFTPEIEREIATQYLAGTSTVALGQAYGSAPWAINEILKRQGVVLRTHQEGVEQRKGHKALHGKPPGLCHHPDCRAKVMTGQKDSAIRCIGHKDLCCRCWERDYEKSTGYCKKCYQQMLDNAGKFRADSRLPAPGGPGARDTEILSVLDEFVPDWGAER